MATIKSKLKKFLFVVFNWLGALMVDFQSAGKGDDVQRINKLLIPLVFFAILSAIWLGWRAHAVAPVLLWVFACLAAGGTTGFLFGIPKSGSKVDAPPSNGENTQGTSSVADPGKEANGVRRARPNTNLEEVSDWLTKIIVGLALVNFKNLKDEVANISLNAAAAIRLNPTESDVSAATALVVGFSLIGFLAMYLYMRLFVQGAIVRSDDQILVYKNAVELAELSSRREPESNPEMESPVVPSNASLQAAQKVANAAPPNQPDLVLQPLRKLASEYEILRQGNEYSRERTRKMTEIVQRMRPHAIAAAPYIGELITSTSTGEHLAATVILQMKYLREHMQWLARRLVEERAFIAYQAASALLARIRVAGVPECKEIQDAVASAKQERARFGIDEPSLDKLITQILDAR